MRQRLYYLFLIGMVVILGLLSREFFIDLPKDIGDILWGLMIFLLMGFIFRDKPTVNIMVFSIIFSIGIEVAKLYHAPWIDTFRYTRIGGLILGYAFSWNNILCYIMGISIGAIGEKIKL